MLTSAVTPISLGILGLVAAFLVYARILQTPAGEGRVKKSLTRFISAPWSSWPASTSVLPYSV